MIDLYALTSPNVQKIYIMLEECALPYTEKFVDVWKGDQYNPDFIQDQSEQQDPAIVDHEGPGGKPYTVIESGAILLYLAEKTGKFLPKDTAKKYDTIQWLMVQLTGVGPMFGQWTHFKMFAPKTGNDYAMTRYNSELKRLYEVLEKRLAQAPYLGGAEYSIADIATFPGRATTTPKGSSGRTTPISRAGSNDRGASGGEGGACQGSAPSSRTAMPRATTRRPLLQPRPLRAWREGPSAGSPLRRSGEGSLDIKGKAAIVTGASSEVGAGAERARDLALARLRRRGQLTRPTRWAPKGSRPNVGGRVRKPSPFGGDVAAGQGTARAWSTRRSSASAGSTCSSTMRRSTEVIPYKRMDLLDADEFQRIFAANLVAAIRCAERASAPRRSAATQPS